MKQPTLHPSDLVVACQVALTPSVQYLQLAQATTISAGECHNAVRRLRLARLILAEELRSPAELLQEFLVHGAPFAFPPVIGPTTVGVPTAHKSPAFHGIMDSVDGFVWPDADGTSRGASLLPLMPGAPGLPERNRPLYDLLSIVDALRLGSARVRKAAIALLSERLATSRV